MGRAPADFAWTIGPATPGALNAAQTIALATRDDGAPAAPALPLGLPTPNPSFGMVRFTLTVPSPTHVRAVVVDALGRTVAVVHDGPAVGPLALAVDVGTLTPGTYALRVATASGTAARWFTVVGR